jgi:cytochrome P450
VLRPVETRLAARRRYGPVFRSNDVLAGELFHVADRDLIEQMFKWKPHEYNVSEPREVMAPVTGPSSILLLDGQRHMRIRKLMLPPFHGEAIAQYAKLIEQITNRELDKWRSGEAIRTRNRRPDDHDGGDHPRRIRHHGSHPDRRAPQAPAAPFVAQPRSC